MCISCVEMGFVQCFYFILFGIQESLEFKVSCLNLICPNDKSMFFFWYFPKFITYKYKTFTQLYMFVYVYIHKTFTQLSVCIIIIIFKCTHAYLGVICWLLIRQKYNFNSYILRSLSIWSIYFSSNQFGTCYFKFAVNLVSTIISQFFLNYLRNQTQIIFTNLQLVQTQISTQQLNKMQIWTQNDCNLKIIEANLTFSKIQGPN